MKYILIVLNFFYLTIVVLPLLILTTVISILFELASFVSLKGGYFNIVDKYKCESLFKKIKNHLFYFVKSIKKLY